KGSNETHSINGDCNTAIKPLKINQHDEPDSPLNHKAICSKYPDDGQSVLLRGRLGTEHAMRDPVASGARVVLIDTALTQADVPLADRDIERSWSYGPAPLSSTDSTFTDRLNTLQAVALRPFSPVHLRGNRDAAGNLYVTWIRRTRKDGTWADSTDVPLNEDAELYDLEVLNGSTVVRTAAGLTSPAYAYSVADQITDFGSAQVSVSIRIYQISGIVGRGTPEEKTL
ncbi:MAG: hypothetical protein ABJL55_09780, partial [Roseibium sp.]